MEASKLLRPYKVELLEKLPEEGKLFFKWFLAITEVHRPSFELAEARKTVIGWAKELGAEVKEDEGGNILCSIPASPGKESVPSLVVQGHLDIVAVGKFEEKGQVPVKLVDGWLTSGVSTLGSDDGFAIASMFALMESQKEFEHGPLEFLITMDEEVGLVGACKLAGPPFMKSRAMLNLDSEEWELFYTSCAGGMSVWYDYTPEREAFEGKRMKVEVSGFMSGHTGLCIQEGRANAVKWLARMLIEAREADYRLVSICGGDKHNAIPACAVAEVIVKDVEKFKAVMTREHEIQRKELAALEKKNPTVVFTDVESGDVPMTLADTNKIINFLMVVHHGVMMNHLEIPDLVNTSQSVSVVMFKDGALKVQVFARSNGDTQMQYLKDYNRAVGDLCGIKVSIPDEECVMPWPPALGSRIMTVAKDVFKRLFGKDPTVTGIHAGLECGAIQNRGYEDLEAISFGPTIHGAHTVEEKTSVETCVKCFQLTLETVKEWAK